MINCLKFQRGLIIVSYLAEIKPDEYVSAFGEAAVQVIGLIEEFVKEMPTIEPEVRHGRWIPYTKNRDENATNVFQCSECEKTVRFILSHEMCEYTFCPNCGAKMYQTGGTISKELFAEIGGADNG